jgi:hypothetical protein
MKVIKMNGKIINLLLKIAINELFEDKEKRNKLIKSTTNKSVGVKKTKNKNAAIVTTSLNSSIIMAIKNRLVIV